VAAVVVVDPASDSSTGFGPDPSAVVVELYRGYGTVEPLDALLGRGFAQVVTTGPRIARIAGHLLADAGAGAGSELAIDALAVAIAVRFGGGIVATQDTLTCASWPVGRSTCPSSRSEHLVSVRRHARPETCRLDVDESDGTEGSDQPPILGATL
jgi:hypothetical protein